MPHRPPASDMLEGVVQNHTADTISFREIKLALHERGFAILLIIFSLPNCIPIPVPPGYSTFFAVPLFFLSAQMLLGRSAPWLPRWIEKKEIKRTTLALMVTKANRYLRSVEKLFKPRMHFFLTSRAERVIGAFAFIFTCSIALPFPLTNLVPAYGIVIMSLGILSRDGLFILLGKAVGLVGLCLTAAIIIIGEKVISWLLF